MISDDDGKKVSAFKGKNRWRMKCGGLMMRNNKNIYDAFLTTREKLMTNINVSLGLFDENRIESSYRNDFDFSRLFVSIN